MDVNGTRFHLLLGRRDFGTRCRLAPGDTTAQTLEDVFQMSAAGGTTAFSWNARQQELTLGTRVFAFTPSAGNRPVTRDDRRGAAFDAYGNTYWIAGNGTEILVHSAGSRKTTHFWSSLDDPRDPACRASATGGFDAIPSDTVASPIALSGLAVTSLHYLVAGTLDPAGLIVFDLHHGGEPRQILWPSGVPFTPFDLAPARDGGVVVLDRAHGTIWALDRTMAVVPLDGAAAAFAGPPQFVPLDPAMEPRPSPCRRLATADMALKTGIAHAAAIDALPDGSVLVLESDPAADFSNVHLFAPGSAPLTLVPSGPVVSLEGARNLVEAAKRSGFRLIAHDLVFTSRDGRDLLYVVASDGDQAFAFELAIEGGALTLTPVTEVFPMRLFGGRGLIAGPGPQAFYDSDQIWVPLTSLRRPRFAESGAFVVTRLDGKDPDCVWHRLMLDAHVPPGCDIVIRSRAANDESRLPFVEWQTEPRLQRRRRGSEFAWTDDLRGAGLETFELLFQRACGRYLQLEVTLRGTGRCSPRVRALRAWYPRFSYLERYLPAVYRENPDSASFLDRFLANAEGIFTGIEEGIAGAQALLDVRSAPPEALDWLARWFHVALDPAWDEERRRLFIRHAAEFFEWRGTVPGLRMALRLATESCANDDSFSVAARASEGVRVIERFRTRPLPGVVFTEVSAADGLPLRTTKAAWDPTLGAADLRARWRAAKGDSSAEYPLTAPADDQGRARWTSFSIQHLGFVPRAGDVERWRATLQRRYPTLDHLNRAWQTSHASWNVVPLPAAVPANPRTLRDWIHFQSVVLPAHDTAHRFMVFLPQGTLGLRDREQRLDLVRRVVALEKPAHTSFQVQFYWAFFRVGEARLGHGTVVDLGSRSPELLSPFVLDRHYLGSGYLAPSRAGRAAPACGCPSSARGEDR